MTIAQYRTKRVAKPWGRIRLWPGFDDPKPGTEPIGEIWFEGGGDTPVSDLMVKYLFTSQKLSIQVHPDDALARRHGAPQGKDEGWLILDAEPDATIALGLVHDVSHAELRAAARDGSIEDLVDWRSVKPGDYIYSPAGTVHAIGAGITMIEVQQAVDLTYRLYDYGRPRELHLDKGVEASMPVPFRARDTGRNLGRGRERLNHGPKFTVERWQGRSGDLLASPGNPALVVPIEGSARIDDHRAEAGSCWISDQPVHVAVTGDALLVARQASAFG